MGIITINNIHKSYGSKNNETQILRGISLDILPGEFVAITGRSGSGKTTLMNIIGLLDIPDDGEYMLDGVTTNGLDDEKLTGLRLRAIGFIFQGFNLIQDISARDNVELPMIYKRLNPDKRKQRSKELLEMVGLGEKMNNKPWQLSGGQMQRVAIARSIANKPKVLLADEPTGNLDTATGQTIMAIIKDLNHRGVTVLMVTHDLSLAQQADRIIMIEDGMITSTMSAAHQRIPTIAEIEQYYGVHKRENRI